MACAAHTKRVTAALTAAGLTGDYGWLQSARVRVRMLRCAVCSAYAAVHGCALYSALYTLYSVSVCLMLVLALMLMLMVLAFFYVPGTLHYPLPAPRPVLFCQRSAF